MAMNVMSTDELKVLAKQHAIENYGSLSKDSLIESLKDKRYSASSHYQYASPPIVSN
jgi:hypothetical protein